MKLKEYPMKNTELWKTGESSPEAVDADSLSAKQELSLSALLSSRTHREAALAAGV